MNKWKPDQICNYGVAFGDRIDGGSYLLWRLQLLNWKIKLLDISKYNSPIYQQKFVWLSINHFFLFRATSIWKVSTRIHISCQTCSSYHNLHRILVTLWNSNQKKWSSIDRIYWSGWITETRIWSKICCIFRSPNNRSGNGRNVFLFKEWRTRCNAQNSIWVKDT